MALYLKRDPRGTRVKGIKPEMIVAMMVMLGIYTEYQCDCVVTSCTDGQHGEHSLHLFGYALDFRTRNLTDIEATEVAGKLAARLSKEYQVVREEDHIHVEFDPR